MNNCVIEDSGCHGLHCRTNSSLIIQNSRIQKNDYDGIYCNDSDSNVVNCIINDNSDYGIYIDGGNAIIKNNWIYKNGDDGIYTNTYTPATIKNNTIVNNADYGIHSFWGVQVAISNCIVWDNKNGSLYTDAGAFDKVTYSCIEGGFTGTGNIGSNPLFYDDPNDPNNYHLSSDSPCIDRGNPAGNYDDETDIDGEDRLIDGDANGTVIVDMGADEYYWSPADFDANEIVNFIDYAMFANYWQKTDSDNDYNDIYDLEDNNSIDYNDLGLFCDDWLWKVGWKIPPPCGCFMGDGMGRGFGIEKMSYSVLLPQQQLEIEPLAVEELLKWLDELWLDEDVRKAIDEDAWLKFIESVKSELE